MANSELPADPFYGPINVKVSPTATAMSWRVVQACGPLAELAEPFAGPRGELVLPEADSWLAELGVHGEASPGPALRAQGLRSNNDALASGAFETQAREFMHFVTHGSLQDLADHKLGGMPWHLSYGKRKAECRLRRENEVKVRLYFETNAGPQAVLGAVVNRLAQRVSAAKEAHRTRWESRAAGNQGEDASGANYDSTLRETMLMTGVALSHGHQDHLLSELAHMRSFAPTVKVNGDTLLVCLETGEVDGEIPCKGKSLIRENPW